MSKKKDNKETNSKEEGTPLESLILNYSEARYPLVSLAVNWAKVLEKKQEHHHLKRNEVLELALGEVLGGKVTKAQIQKGLQALKEQLAAEAEEAAKAAKKDVKELGGEEEEVKEEGKKKETAGSKKK